MLYPIVALNGLDDKKCSLTIDPRAIQGWQKRTGC